MRPWPWYFSGPMIALVLFYSYGQEKRLVCLLIYAPSVLS